MIINNKVDILNRMKHSPIDNYVLPGLASWLVGGCKDGADFGKVRLFEASRVQREFVTPHSHKFSFIAFVMQGTVTNTLYSVYNGVDMRFDEMFMPCRVTPKGGIGDGYDIENLEDTPRSYTQHSRDYVAGDSYAMNHDEIHSIRFSSDAVVLFLEGEQVQEDSVALLPWLGDEVINTLEIKPWMFRK